MNRNRCRAALGAAAVIASLLASGAGVSPAVAATTGDHGAQVGQSAGKDVTKSKGKSADAKAKGKGKGGDKGADKLAKAIAVTDARLVKLLSKAEKLDSDAYARVAANIEADRAMLPQLTTADDVRALRPENYERVIAGVRKVASLVAQVEAPDAAITESAAALVEQLFTVTATTDKAELRVVKAGINHLEELVEAALAVTTDPGTTDAGTTDPGTGGEDVVA